MHWWGSPWLLLRRVRDASQVVRDGSILPASQASLSLLKPEPKSKFSLLRHILQFSQYPETLVDPEEGFAIFIAFSGPRLETL